MCNILKEIYKKVFSTSFDYSDFDKRIELQKAIYLLDNMGVHVGEYGFIWSKYGPYSISLDSDAARYSEIPENTNIPFSQFAETTFNKLKEYISMNNNEYSRVHWIECIASLHYLYNVMRIPSDYLIKELKEKKPYLNNEKMNYKATQIIREMS